MTLSRQAELDPRSRRQRRQAAAVARAEARERRWAERRYAVPYDTDGPKVTLGVVWFAAVVGAALWRAEAVAVVVAAAAVVAALQVAAAWRYEVPLGSWWVAATAAALPVAAWAGGVTALGAAVLAAVVVAASTAVLSEGGLQPRAVRVADIGVRAVVPAGLAAGSLAALAVRDPGTMVALVLVVSMYEAGDFIIGTGSSNAVEGPLAGLVAAGIVGLVLLVVQPFGDADGRVLVGSAVVLAPVGQVAASAVLPRGAAWAPALRRLDSYLLVAPLWVLVS